MAMAFQNGSWQSRYPEPFRKFNEKVVSQVKRPFANKNSFEGRTDYKVNDEKSNRTFLS